MNIITIGIIASSLMAIILVLLQDRSSGTGGAFGGGSSEGGFYQTRRGMEKFLFVATIVAIASFSSLSIVNLIEAKHRSPAPQAPAVNIETNSPGTVFTPDSAAPAQPAN